MKSSVSLPLPGLAWLALLSMGIESAANEQPTEPPSRAEQWSPHALVELHVIDAQTEAPLKGARVIVGTSFSSSRGWNWQDHTLFKVDGSVVRWPRADEKGYQLQVIRVEVPGYVPYHTVPITRADSERHVPEDALRVVNGEPICLEARLSPDQMPTVRLLQPDGTPASGGQVAIAMNQREVRIEGRGLHTRDLPPKPKPGELWEQPVMTTADEHGDFRLPVEIAHRAVVVAAHESGFALVPVEEFYGNNQLQLEPWGTIHGQAILGGEPAADVRLRVHLRTRLMIDDYLEQLVIVTTDHEGRFAIEHATPGLVNISTIPDLPKEMDSHPRTHGLVKAGGVTELVYGGIGRPVVGRVVGLDDYEGLIATCELPGPSWRYGGKSNRRFAGFMRSAVGEAYRQTPVEVAADGTFRFERVSPEFYHVDIWRITANGDRERHGVRRQFSFPMLPQSENDLPLDLGDFKPYEPR
ncbi:hypothetical protein Pla108_42000 [Botrimarina colliarenosi]|uniref:Nickel uptake substrate-specific transmembrane region n=1 Tax=Botrimarina colliarenosi TaxID=2528001 RepID=A0A5C5ZXC2_9BACT|nr:hypothetical protein [Botrimarina colliarenosi]TWT91790.1 hypothetical protein Pla108_42000 [Botrimarina colliarenosi]